MHQNVLFDSIHTIAIVGLSDNPERASYEVAEYLQKKGFRIVPVNPHIDEVLDEKAYPSIAAIPEYIHIDAVDIFRKSEEVVPHVKEAIERGGIQTVWLQEGIVSHESEKLALDHKIHIVMNACLMKSHKNR